MNNNNILIAGAGPAGLAAALELARRGYEPRIVDKGSDFTPEDESRALGVNNRTLQLLGPSGVTEELLSVGQEVTHFRVMNEKNQDVIRFDFSGAGALYPFMLVVPQGRTERLLAKALSSHGVEIEWGTEVSAANSDPAKPRLDIDHAGNVTTVSPDILIGADGAGSTIRKSFGFSFDGESYPVEFGLADFELEEPYDASEGFVHFSDRGVLGRIPINKNVARYISPRPDISEALPDDLKIKQVIWRSSFNINFRHVEHMQRGRVFLAGDAAHIHSPAGARGMNLGIEDACWLAWLIEEGKTANYSALRMPEVKKVIAQTKQQTDGLLRLSAAAKFARDHVANGLLKIPPFKRRALKRITGLDTADPPWIS